MGADEIAAIRPAIAELEADLEEHGVPARFFARFSLSNQETPWIEVVIEDKTTINLSYPFADEPLQLLQRSAVECPPGLKVTDRSPNAITFAFARSHTRAVARFIDALFTRVLGCGQEYSVDVSFLRFPPPTPRLSRRS